MKLSDLNSLGMENKQVFKTAVSFPSIAENASVEQIQESLGYVLRKMYQVNEHKSRIKYRLIYEQFLTDITNNFKNGKLTMKELEQLREWIDSAGKSGVLNESVDQAEVLVAAKGMGTDIQSMYEKTAKMLTTDLLNVTEEIKNKFGEEVANQFYSAASSSLQTTVDSLKSSFETLNDAAHSVASGESIVQPGSMEDYDELSDVDDGEDLEMDDALDSMDDDVESTGGQGLGGRDLKGDL